MIMSTFETANFGNYNGSHQLLKSSLQATASVLDVLRFLVDRPAGHIGSEINWSPYWGCGSVENWWVLWQGVEDVSAPRKNMVMAKVVLVPIEHCAKHENFDELLAAVGYIVPEEETSALLPLATSVVDCLSKGTRPTVIPNLSVAPLLLRLLWARLWPSARVSLSLRTFFGVESLESDYLPDIIVIPTELRPRWGEHVLIDRQKLSCDSPISLWFCGKASEKLNGLLWANVSKLPSDISVIERIDRIAGCLERLHSSNGTIADALLVMRSLESFQEQLVLPEGDIEIVADMLENFSSATVGEIRTASLVKLDILENHVKFKKAVSQWVEYQLPEQPVKDALWIIEQHTGTLHSDWWRISVGKGIANGCKSMSPIWGHALWIWWESDSTSLQHVMKYIPTNIKCEQWISAYTPDYVDDELLAAIIDFCRERKWTHLLAKSLGTTRPLRHCIEVLRNTVPNPDAGLDTLLNERSAEEIVDIAAIMLWDPLVDKAILLTIKSPQLLARLSDFKKIMPILLHHLSKGGDFPTDLLTDIFLEKILDTISEDEESCMEIIKRIGPAAGKYLIGHKNEEKLWQSVLPFVSKDFVAEAVDEWWKRFLNNEEMMKPAHLICENVIKSSSGKLRNLPITSVIKFLNLLPNFSEAQFQRWMNDEGFDWTTGGHKRLADVLLERKWKETVNKFRWSWKRELNIVAWHARELLSWYNDFSQPPEGANQEIFKKELNLTKKEMKILFLAANPISSNRLALDEEVRSIEKKVRSSKYEKSVLFRTRWAVRPSDLQHAILEDEPTIVHFSGHGGGSVGIVMHSTTQNNESLVTSETLADLFRVLRDGIRVVVLNACYSEVQAKAICKQIDFVVGMSDSIGDEAARVFAAAFYRGLSFGKSVQTAFDLGINELGLMGLNDDKIIPRLLIRDGIDATTTFLITAS